MICKLLKKSISLALAFAIVLSLSCCGISGETIPKPTINEITETTSEITPENIAEALQVTPEELSILAELNSYEKETWQTMPDIVTIRILSYFEPERLQTEVVYIDKWGNVKKFIGPYTTPREYDSSLDWATDQISQNKDAELVDVADIHTLIEFYNTFKRVDRDYKFYCGYEMLSYVDKANYGFGIYGIRSDGENGFETLKFSRGTEYEYEIRLNDINNEDYIDMSGIEAFDLYLKLDLLIKDAGGVLGWVA
ncbi:MAG: hypothetical protein J1E40_07820 [Oscillospiraceae bacterium]|nr:hypothetical protein [Oscillospiraceae bacterium]